MGGHSEPRGDLAEHAGGASRRTVLKALLGAAGATVAGGCLTKITRSSGSAAAPSAASPDNPPPTVQKVAATSAGRAHAYLPPTRFIQHGPPTRPNVAVTVDDFFDAAGADYLAGLLTLARQRQIQLTLFPTGKALDDHARLGRGDLWRQAVTDGHVIGNHTYHHFLATKPPYQGFADLAPVDRQRELDLTRLSLNRVLGFSYDEYLMRPPGGSGGYPEQANHAPTLAKIAAAGYYMVMWTTDSNTATGQITTVDEDERFLQKMFTDPHEQVRNGSIVLVHPTTLSLAGMSRLLDGLTARRLACRTVPALFEP